MRFRIFLSTFLMYNALNTAVSAKACYDWGNNPVFQHRPKAKSALTFEDLKTFVDRNKIQSPLQMLEAFAKDSRFKDFLSNYTLISRSSALHAERDPKMQIPELPRVSLHKDRLYFLVKADPKSPGGLFVEVIEEDPKTGKHKMRALDFSAEGEKRFRKDLDVHVVPKDSEKAKLLGGRVGCVGCHGEDHRQGSLRSTLRWQPSDNFHNNRTEVFGSQHDLIVKGTEEYQSFEKFLDIVDDKSDDRGKIYRALAPLKYKKTPDGIELTDKPNLRMSQHVNQSIAISLGAKISNLKNYSAMQFAFVGAFLNCENLKDFYPESYNDTLKKNMTIKGPYPIGVRTRNTRKGNTVEGFAEETQKQFNEVTYGIYYFGFTRFLERSKDNEAWNKKFANFNGTKEELFDAQFKEYEKLKIKEWEYKYASTYGQKQLASWKKNNEKQRKMLDSIAKVRYVLASQGIRNRHLGPIVNNTFSPRVRFESRGIQFSDILRCELGAAFLAANPELNKDMFQDNIVDEAHLFDKVKYCDKLAAASHKAIDGIAPEANMKPMARSEKSVNFPTSVISDFSALPYQESHKP